jgi:hypothetical protein
MHTKIGHPNTCLILHITSHKSLQPAGLSCGVKEKNYKKSTIYGILSFTDHQLLVCGRRHNERFDSTGLLLNT